MRRRDDLFAPERDRANRERAALLKRRVSVADAMTALGLDETPACPRCGGLLGEPRGESVLCECCEERFDAIALVRAARGLSFKGACDFLEAACLDRAGDRQGRML